MPGLNIPYRHVQMLEDARPGVSRNIIAEDWIDTAVNARENPAMMALVKIYQLLPGDPEMKDPNCHMCRGKILNSFQLMKPYLKHGAGLVPVDADFRDWSYRQQYEETLNVKL